jgi:ribonuclease HII
MDSFEKDAYHRGYKFIAGIDEAGRGPLAGPVVAAAVILPMNYKNDEINDSKKLSPKRRERLYDAIYSDAIAIGLGVVEPLIIDTVNILQATLTAMQEAVLNLTCPVDYLLIDGKRQLSVSLPQEAIVKGDAKSISVASASIIAKVSRDRIMEIYHRQFPQYNFLKNKGYCTEELLSAIRKYGVCKIHRKSFKIATASPLPETGDLFAENNFR